MQGISEADLTMLVAQRGAFEVAARKRNNVARSARLG
jgi:hypothetical protein